MAPPNAIIAKTVVWALWGLFVPPTLHAGIVGIHL